MGNIIGAVILGIVAIVCFVFGYLQFHEKGFLFNNAIYTLLSKKKKLWSYSLNVFSALLSNQDGLSTKGVLHFVLYLSQYINNICIIYCHFYHFHKF